VSLLLVGIAKPLVDDGKGLCLWVDWVENKFSFVDYIFVPVDMGSENVELDKIKSLYSEL